MSKTLALQPRLTEKTYGLSSAKSAVYCFDVEPGANSHSVKRAVEAQFEVKVASVRVLNQKGKSKRSIVKKGRKVYAGREAASKKAYVTLAAGQNLPFFQAIEEEEQKQAETQAKMEKAMEKQEAKEAKKEGNIEAKSRPKAASKPSAKPVEQPAEEPESKPRGFMRLRGRRGNKENK